MTDTEPTLGQRHVDAMLSPTNSAPVLHANSLLVASSLRCDPEYAAALRIVADEEHPVTGVYSVSDIAWECVDGLEELDAGYEDAKREHLEECAICREEEEGYCDWDDYCESGPGGRAYADTPWVWDDEAQEWDAPGATLMFFEGESEVQVVKSPVTMKRGWASPCFPGQTCSDTPGDVPCFAMPDDLLRGDTW